MRSKVSKLSLHCVGHSSRKLYHNREYKWVLLFWAATAGLDECPGSGRFTRASREHPNNARGQWMLSFHKIFVKIDYFFKFLYFTKITKFRNINQFHETRPKKLVKSNKSISRKKIFWRKSIFCNFKNGQKSIFELGKSLKLSKMQFHEIFYLIFTVGQKIQESPGKKTCEIK